MSMRHEARLNQLEARVTELEKELHDFLTEEVAEPKSSGNGDDLSTPSTSGKETLGLNKGKGK